MLHICTGIQEIIKSGKRLNPIYQPQYFLLRPSIGSQALVRSLFIAPSKHTLQQIFAFTKSDNSRGRPKVMVVVKGSLVQLYAESLIDSTKLLYFNNVPVPTSVDSECPVLYQVLK